MLWINHIHHPKKAYSIETITSYLVSFRMIPNTALWYKRLTIGFLVAMLVPDIKVLIAAASISMTSILNKHTASYTARYRPPHP